MCLEHWLFAIMNENLNVCWLINVTGVKLCLHWRSMRQTCTHQWPNIYLSWLPGKHNSLRHSSLLCLVVNYYHKYVQNIGPDMFAIINKDFNVCGLINVTGVKLCLHWRSLRQKCTQQWPNIYLSWPLELDNSQRQSSLLCLVVNYDCKCV